MATEFAPNQPTDQGAGTGLRFHRVAMAAALAAMSLSAGSAWALGLGRLNVQSALGEPLRAEIDVTAISAQENASLKARVASPETYRAAGIDYNQVLATAQVTLQRRADGSPFLRLSSDRAVTEPFVDAILDMQWSSGRLVREYTLLFDPPSLASSAAANEPAPEPYITPVIMDPVPVVAPKPAPVVAPAPVAEAKPTTVDPEADDLGDDDTDVADAKPSSPAPVAAAPKPVPPVTRAPAPVAKPTPAPADAAGDASARTLNVRPGDALSFLAERALTPGLSLDQMMVSLYRGNPQAFVNNNMNRLKSGVVLKVPDPESTKAISPEQARQVIVAQSSDFESFRQRLATNVTTSVAPTQQRQATGKVEAEVTDRKQAEAPKPDKLTLSKGGMSAGKTPAVEDRIAQKRATQDSTTRVAELSRNLDDLQKLKEQVAPKVAPKVAVTPPPVKPTAPVVTPPVVKPLVVTPPSPPPVLASAPVPKLTPSPVSKAEADDLLGDDDVALDTDTPASAAATAVANVASQPASEPAEAFTPAVTAQLPAQVESGSSVAESADAPQGGFMDKVSPAMLAGAGALVALLAGGGLYLRSRRKNDGAETSFLESRLQPDSFFGASGGQRVDTRDAASPSSMSYSLSQLDAIGDVDPVAEADVYLAYGRDLQAEEILKEALRTTPDRPAIRTKLMEVYAKRRDTKGVEFMAKDLLQITQGQGPDWQRAQELGMSVDPGNPIYQPAVADVPALEMDRTLPLSAMPVASAAIASLPDMADAGDTGGGELDLDISLPPTPEMLGHAHTDPQKFDPTPVHMQSAAKPAADTDVSIDFDLPTLDIPGGTPAAPATATVASAPAKPFDLSTISLDLDDDQTVIKPAKAAAPVPEFVASNPVPIDVVNDPMMRKVELAHEFIQIGDVDGAKDLLKEVMADGQEVSRAKARELLDRLT